MMKAKKVLACLMAWGIVSSSVPSGAWAAVSEEEMLFAEIPTVLSSGFFAMSRLKAPGSTYVISQEQIASSPARNIGQLLDMNAPGVVIGHHERTGDLYGTRGILIDNNSKTLFLFDGQNINQRMHFGYQTGMNLPFLDDLQTVEVINGPGAIVHGSGAINGFVNMIPKNGTTNPGSFVKTEYGPREKSYNVQTGYGKSYGAKKDLFLFAGFQSAAGRAVGHSYGLEKDGDVTGNPQYISNLRVFGYDPTYKITSIWNHGDFNLNFYYFNIDKNPNAEENVGGIAPQHSVVHQSQMAIRPRYTLHFGDKESLELTGSSEISDHGMNYTDQQVRQGGAEYHMEGKALLKTTRMNKHSFAVGSLWGKRQFRGKKQYLSKIKLQGDFEGIDARWNEMGIFAEDVYQPTDALTFSLGLRYDQVDYRDLPGFVIPKDLDHTSPRVAAAYEFNPETSVKASYQNGFRTPDARYVFWKPYWDNNLAAAGHANIKYPDFKPESMDSYEMNIHKELRNQKLSFDTNLYYNTYKDTMLWYGFSEGDNYFPAGVVTDVLATAGWFGAFVNTKGEFSSLGGELVTNWAPSTRVKTEVSYSYSQPVGLLKSEDSGFANSNQTNWARYNPHIVKANVTSKWFEDKLLWNLGGVYGSTIDRASASVRNYFAKPRIWVNSAAEYAFTDSFSLRLTGQNLLGRDVPPPTIKMNEPWSGNLGADEVLYYVEAKLKFK
jgi:outer membrane receptor protein involved in Fe transport